MLVTAIQIKCDGTDPDGDCLLFSDAAATVKEARDLASATGWHLSMIPGGPDYCPNCWEMLEKAE